MYSTVLEWFCDSAKLGQLGPIAIIYFQWIAKSSNMTNKSNICSLLMNVPTHLHQLPTISVCLRLDLFLKCHICPIEFKMLCFSNLISKYYICPISKPSLCSGFHLSCFLDEPRHAWGRTHRDVVFVHDFICLASRKPRLPSGQRIMKISLIKSIFTVLLDEPRLPSRQHIKKLILFRISFALLLDQPKLSSGWRMRTLSLFRTSVVLLLDEL